MDYVVRNESHLDLFWSNQDGWTDLEYATVFTYEEVIRFLCPIEGTWVKLPTKE